MREPSEDSGWCLVQEGMLKTLSVPKTGMAITIDIGEAGDIHPKNKQEVGRRLSLAARGIAYGQDIPYSGPMYDYMAVEGNKIRIYFTKTDGGLMRTGEELKGFAIAAEERSKHLPDMPTLKELGVDMVFALKRGIVAPKGTPRDVIDHWAGIFKAAAENPDLLAQMDAKGTDVGYQDPDAYRAWAENLYTEYEDVAVAMGMWTK